MGRLFKRSLADAQQNRVPSHFHFAQSWYIKTVHCEYYRVVIKNRGESHLIPRNDSPLERPGGVLNPGLS